MAGNERVSDLVLLAGADISNSDDLYIVDVSAAAGSRSKRTTVLDLAQAISSGAYQPSDAQLTSLAALSYSGNALRVVRVNAAATGFELADPSGGGVTWGSITGTLSAQTDLQSAISNKQDFDAALNSLAGLTVAANVIPVGSGSDTFAALSVTSNTFPARSSSGGVAAKPLTDFALTLLDDATASEVRTTIGAGTSSFDGAFASLSGKPTTLAGYGVTDAQPLDGTLTALAALTIAANSLTMGTGADAFTQTSFAANKFPARSSTGSLGAKDVTDFALSVLDDTDAATVRATIGAGTSSFSGAFADLSGKPTTLSGYGITDAQGLDAALTALAAGSDFVQFTGPLSTTRIFTLPNSSETLLYSGGPLGTPSSGVGTNLTGTATGLTVGNATLASTVTVADAADDATCWVALARSQTGNQAICTDAEITYNASTGILAVNISGNAATVTTNANLTGPVTSVGNATTIAAGVVTEAMQVLADNTTGDVSTNKHGYAPKGDGTTTKFLNANGVYSTPTTTAALVTVANEATDTTCFPLFSTAATGDLGPKTNAALTFNSNTANLGCTTFTGALAGNATTATALATVRTIGGSNFDGSANVTSFPSPGAIGGSTPAAGTFTALTSTSGSVTGLTALAIRDTSAAFDLTITGTSSTAFTAGRTLTLDLVNAARTLKISGNPTISDWFDQSVKASASPTFVTVTAALAGNATTATTLATSRNLWGQAFDGSAAVTGSLTSVADITGGASSMTITAGTGASRTLVLKTTTSGSTATTALTLAADQSATFANTVNATTFVGALTGTASGNLVSGGALGTPSSGTLTSCTGLPISGLTASTSTALGVGSVELGHATDTTISRSGAGKVAVEGKAVPLMSGAFDAIFAGPTATRTYTFPDADAAVIYSGGAGGTPSSLTLTNATGLPASSLTAGILAANITFGENVELILDAALSADGKYCGLTEDGTAAAALAFGEVCYFVAASSRWNLAKADSSTTSGPVKIGICVLAAAGAASATKILLWGKIRADAKFPTMTIGAPVFISGATAGAVVTAAPTTTDFVTRILGYGNTADELFWNPSNDYYTHT